MNRREYLGGMASVPMIGSATAESQAAATDSSTGPIGIGADDDLQSIIEDAGPNSWFVIEPGTVHQVDPPLRIPPRTVIDGGNDARSPWDTTIEKAGDGPMATVEQQTTIRGVHFDGRRDEGFGGDGLVDRNWNQTQIRMSGVTIRKCKGDARVHNTTNRWLYQDVRLVNNGGFGIRNISTDHDGPRRGMFLGGSISRNLSGGIYTAPGAHERDNFYYTTFRANRGPGYIHDSGDDKLSSNVRIYGNMRMNDGPAIYIKSGYLRGWDLGGKMGNNNHDLQRAGLGNDPGPVGQVLHNTSDASYSQLIVSGGQWRVIGPGNSAVSSRNGEVRLTISGCDATGGTVDGNVTLSILDALGFKCDCANARRGIAISPEGFIKVYPSGKHIA